MGGTGTVAATRVGVGWSEQADSRRAGAEAARLALANAGTSESQLALLFTTGKHDPRAFHAGVRSALGPGPRLIGGYSVGVITNDFLGYDGHQVGVAVFASPGMKVDIFAQDGLNRGEREAGIALGRQIARARFDGEPNMLLMYDAVRARSEKGMALNCATPLLDGMTVSLGDWPRMAGVGMMGNIAASPTWQWCDDRVEQQLAMALMMHGGVRMDTVIMHGCRPAGPYRTITRAEGATVLEIDGRPALDAIIDMLGGAGANVQLDEFPLLVTLGVNKGDPFEFDEEQYANRLCMAVDEARRGLIMFEPDLVAGSRVQLMRRSINFDYVAERTRKVFDGLDGRRPIFAFYIDCLGRASAFCGTDGEEAAAVQRAVGPDVPLCGIYSGVEIARVGGAVQALDWTGVLCVLSE
jgi:hypothetical protein